MPIYEFFCPVCNRIFSFFSRRIDVDTRPFCPTCRKRRLSREVSAFASLGRHKGEDADLAGDSPLDSPRVEQAMESLASEAAGLDENDPRQAATLMRRFSEATGMKLGEGMEEAMRRLEAGEDPETVEAEMGDRLEGEDPLSPGGGKARGAKRSPPSRDPTLYDMESGG